MGLQINNKMNYMLNLKNFTHLTLSPMRHRTDCKPATTPQAGARDGAGRGLSSRD